MNVRFILDEPPYGTERASNASRLAMQLAKRGDVTLRVFLMADAASCAKRGQDTPDGSYKIAGMLHGLVAENAGIGACGTCMDARGPTGEELLDGVHRSSMDDLADWTMEADEAVVF